MGTLYFRPLVRGAQRHAMKVLHVIPSVAPRYGGPSRAVLEMCRELCAQGVETLIATTDANGESRLAVELGQQVLYENVPAIFFRRQWSESYKYSRPLAQWLESHIGDFDVAHIHAVFSHACLAAARACRKKGVPYIVRPLGTLDPWSIRQKSLRKKLFWHLGVRRMLASAAALHYTALTERHLAEASLGLTRGVVIPLGINVDASDEAVTTGNDTDFITAGDDPYVLVLSRLHQKKGLELLLPAFLSVVKRREFAEWKLVLAGDGKRHYIDSLQRLARTGGGTDHVIFTGWLEGERRESILKRAKLLALTSYQENFGLCLIEALAHGVPVLVSDQVNIALEIEGAEAGWVTPLEQTCISRTLEAALHSEVERKRRGHMGRNLIMDKYSWNTIARQLATLYRSIITG